MEDVPAVLHGLPSMAFGYMLVIARVGSAMLTGPGLGEAEIPPTIRALLAAVFAALVYPMLRVQLPLPPQAVPDLVEMIALEILVGAWIGFLARVLVMALSMAGGIVSFMIGLTSVLQIDPELGVQVPALQRLLGLAAIAVLFATGLYLLPVQAILGSYDLIPPGGAFDSGGAAMLITRAITDSFGLAIRLAAPFIVTCMVWQATMGFLTRLVPNIHVHLLSAPAQILGGLALLSAAVIVLFSNWSEGMTKSLSALPGL